MTTLGVWILVVANLDWLLQLFGVHFRVFGWLGSTGATAVYVGATVIACVLVFIGIRKNTIHRRQTRTAPQERHP